MKYVLLASLLLVGCKTVTTMQSSCESAYSDFPSIYKCTKQKVTSEARMANSQEVKYYLLVGEKLSDQVTSGKISNLDAKVEWQKVFVDLKAKEQMATPYYIPPPAQTQLPRTPTTCTSYQMGYNVNTTCQ